mmetsp:Transcript_43431/g.100670  ORF Transcript_43431/g.100670 Transcript_43431/m.100670 type:complete len:247 (-) Transcript_43431:630-1370(-)
MEALLFSSTVVAMPSPTRSRWYFICFLWFCCALRSALRAAFSRYRLCTFMQALSMISTSLSLRSRMRPSQAWKFAEMLPPCTMKCRISLARFSCSDFTHLFLHAANVSAITSIAFLSSSSSRTNSFHALNVSRTRAFVLRPPNGAMARRTRASSADRCFHSLNVDASFLPATMLSLERALDWPSLTSMRNMTHCTKDFLTPVANIFWRLRLEASSACSFFIALGSSAAPAAFWVWIRRASIWRSMM